MLLEALLQCDRACEGAEMLACAALRSFKSWLQCDRACEGAEMQFYPAAQASAIVASM